MHFILSIDVIERNWPWNDLIDLLISIVQSSSLLQPNYTIYFLLHRLTRSRGREFKMTKDNLKVVNLKKYPSFCVFSLEHKK